MKRILTKAIGLSALGFFAQSATAASYNITGNDNDAAPAHYWNGASASTSIGGEDNETEATPNTIRGQMWDLEAFNWDDTSLTLSLIGGYDLRNTTGGSIYGSGSLYNSGRPGQLFIKITPGTSVTSQPTGAAGDVLNSLYDYDYAIDLMTGNYMELTSSTVLQTVIYDALNSNPWKVKDNNWVTTGTTTLDWVTGKTAAEVDALLASGGAYTASTLLADTGAGFDAPLAVYTHNVMGIDFSFLSGKSSASDNILLHYTMECGNDHIVGSTAGGFRVPDGGSSLLLLGFSITGLGLVGRRFRG